MFSVSSVFARNPVLGAVYIKDIIFSKKGHKKIHIFSKHFSLIILLYQQTDQYVVMQLSAGKAYRNIFP